MAEQRRLDYNLGNVSFGILRLTGDNLIRNTGPEGTEIIVPACATSDDGRVFRRLGFPQANDEYINGKFAVSQMLNGVRIDPWRRAGK